MHTLRGTDSLIRRAYENVEPDGAYPIPSAQRPVRALLGSPSIITPPPEDTSYVRGAQGMYAPPNPARALPPATTHIMPPPDTTTTAILIDAAKGIQRGANGRFFKVFSNGARVPLSDQQLMDLRSSPLTMKDLQRLQEGSK
jgi:hypothetical protein